MQADGSSGLSGRMLVIGLKVGVLCGLVWAGILAVALVAAGAARGRSVVMTFSQMNGTVTFLWLLTSVLVASGVFLYFLLFGAQVVRVEGSELHVRTIASGQRRIAQELLYRPVINRGAFGGVLFFRKGARTASLVVTGEDALMVAHLPVYASLPLCPLYEARPKQVAAYEQRLRST